MLNHHNDFEEIKNLILEAQRLGNINTHENDLEQILRMKAVLHLTRARKLTSALILKISEETNANT